MNSELDNDAQMLAKLLREYTASLREELQSRDRMAFRGQIVQMTTGLFLGTIATLVGFFGKSLEISASLWPIIFIIAGIVATASWLLNYKQRSLSNEEIDVLAHKLDKIARRASQQMEHARPSFAVELELDLRLTEAEAALRKADRFVQVPNKLSSDYLTSKGSSRSKRERPIDSTKSEG